MKKILPGTCSDQIHVYLQKAYDLLEQIAPSSLRPSQRPTVGGTLFHEGPQFVRYVLDGLASAPELFPDVAFAPTDLGEVQRRAEAWNTLAGVLGDMARQAADHHLETQACAIQMSKAALSNVQVGLQHPTLMPHLDHHSRALVMVQAIDLMAGIHNRKRPRRPGAPPVAASPAAPPAAASPAAPPAAPYPIAPPPAAPTARAPRSARAGSTRSRR